LEQTEYEQDELCLLHGGWRLILRGGIDSGANPYEHLEKYLEREALDEIERLPHRSAMQVNRIIELIDEHGACNDELRELAYCLFKVKGGDIPRTISAAQGASSKT
jgi:hypothetical protein